MRDRWKYLFEGGSKEDVLTALAVYQNDDGGFGHALEPDCWNPDSSPIQTWVATEIIHEIGLEDKGPPVVQGILRYLSSGKDFDGHTWANTIASNNAAPHASWWEHTPAAEPSYNPTACLIAFILKFADRESRLFALACDLAKEAYSYFKPFKDNRAFCKYICPITVFLKPMSYFSMLRIKCDASKCIFCGKCKRVCPMNVDVTDNSRKREHGTECILCLECVRHCPRGLCRRTGRLWRRRCRTTDP